MLSTLYETHTVCLEERNPVTVTPHENRCICACTAHVAPLLCHATVNQSRVNAALKQGDGMRSKWMFVLAVALTTSFFAILLSISRPARAQGGGRILARSQFRQTTSPSDFQPPAPHSAPGPVG